MGQEQRQAFPRALPLLPLQSIPHIAVYTHPILPLVLSPQQLPVQIPLLHIQRLLSDPFGRPSLLQPINTTPGDDLGQAAGTICVLRVYSYPRDRSINLKPFRWGVGSPGRSGVVMSPTSLSEFVSGWSR